MSSQQTVCARTVHAHRTFASNDSDLSTHVRHVKRFAVSGRRWKVTLAVAEKVQTRFRELGGPRRNA